MNFTPLSCYFQFSTSKCSSKGKRNYHLICIHRILNPQPCPRILHQSANFWCDRTQTSPPIQPQTQFQVTQRFVNGFTKLTPQLVAGYHFKLKPQLPTQLQGRFNLQIHLTQVIKSKKLTSFKFYMSLQFQICKSTPKYLVIDTHVNSNDGLHLCTWPIAQSLH